MSCKHHRAQSDLRRKLPMTTKWIVRYKQFRVPSGPIDQDGIEAELKGYGAEGDARLAGGIGGDGGDG